MVPVQLNKTMCTSCSWYKNLLYHYVSMWLLVYRLVVCSVTKESSNQMKHLLSSCKDFFCTLLGSMDGFRVVKLDEVVRIADVIITASGE